MVEDKQLGWLNIDPEKGDSVWFWTDAWGAEISLEDLMKLTGHDKLRPENQRNFHIEVRRKVKE